MGGAFPGFVEPCGTDAVLYVCGSASNEALNVDINQLHSLKPNVELSVHPVLQQQHENMKDLSCSHVVAGAKTDGLCSTLPSGSPSVL